MQELTSKIVKTRKPHKCWGCAKEYPAGTKMKYCESVDQGEFTNTYWCDSCEKIRGKLESWEQSEGFAFGELLEYEKETT